MTSRFMSQFQIFAEKLGSSLFTIVYTKTSFSQKGGSRLAPPVSYLLKWHQS